MNLTLVHQSGRIVAPQSVVLRGIIGHFFGGTILDAAPSDRRYTETHEWVRLDDGMAVVGITAYAARELGDLAYLDLPKVGGNVVAKERFGEIESVKAVSELFSPVGGEITAVNAALAANLDAVVSDPYGVGWMIKIRPANPEHIGTLLTAEAYQAFCATIEH